MVLWENGWIIDVERAQEVLNCELTSSMSLDATGCLEPLVSLRNKYDSNNESNYLTLCIIIGIAPELFG